MSINAWNKRQRGKIVGNNDNKNEEWNKQNSHNDHNVNWHDCKTVMKTYESWNEAKTIITNKLIANWINFSVYFLDSVCLLLQKFLLSIETIHKTNPPTTTKEPLQIGDFHFERCMSLFTYFFLYLSLSDLMRTNWKQTTWTCISVFGMSDSRFLHIIIQLHTNLYHASAMITTWVHFILFLKHFKCVYI